MTEQLKTALTILRRKQVTARTGLPTATLYALMAGDNFPRPLQLTAKAVGWRSDEIEAWIESRARSAGRKVAA